LHTANTIEIPLNFENRTTDGRVMAKYVMCSGQKMNFGKILVKLDIAQCTEMRFASFLSGVFTSMAVINPPESKLAKCSDLDGSVLSKNQNRQLLILQTFMGSDIS
jgi:hypothetical protein